MLEALEVPEMPEVMRCVLLCTLEAVEGGLCSLEVLEMLTMLEVPEVMRCVLRCMLEVPELMRCVLRCIAGGCGGDALYAARMLLVCWRLRKVGAVC